MRKIVLASASPRRKELLGQMGLEFLVDSSDIEEVVVGDCQEDIVKGLARSKADDVARRYEGDVVVIGADTLVVLGDQILGKPVDEKDACLVLRELSGKVHQVYTGVCVVIKDSIREERIVSFVEKSDVWVNELSDEEIGSYIETKEPFDKAGSYGIQGRFGIHISRIEGDYNNIVGLPIARLYKELKREGIC